MDEAFVGITDASTLQQWADKVKGGYPRSANVYNSLIMHSKGWLDVYNFYVLKDAVQADVILMKDKNGESTVTAYCPPSQEQLLIDALKCTSVLNWKTDAMFCFHSLPLSLATEVQKVMEEKIGGSVQSATGSLFTYNINEDLENCRSPAGTALKQLSASSAKLAFSLWRYKECGDTTNFEKLCTVCDVSVGLHTDEDADHSVLDVPLDGVPRATDEDKPLAWAACAMQGSLGILGCTEPANEAHLPRVMRCCARLIKRAGLLPHCYPEQGKDTVRDQPGWKAVGSVTWLWK